MPRGRALHSYIDLPNVGENLPLEVPLIRSPNLQRRSQDEPLEFLSSPLITGRRARVRT